MKWSSSFAENAIGCGEPLIIKAPFEISGSIPKEHNSRQSATAKPAEETENIANDDRNRQAVNLSCSGPRNWNIRPAYRQQMCEQSGKNSDQPVRRRE